MPLPKTVTLDYDLKFDFTNPESTIDYLIYITQPLNYSIIVQNLMMLEQKDAVKLFLKKNTPINYPMIYHECNLSLIPFDNMFISKELTFLFQDFLYDESISIHKRKTKLNSLVNNFRGILKYIYIQTDIEVIRKLEKSEVPDLVKLFRNKFSSQDLMDSNPSTYFTFSVYSTKLPLVIHNLMLYCIGYRFRMFYSKLLNDFSVFLDNSNHEQLASESKTLNIAKKQLDTKEKTEELPEETIENPYPRIFLNNDAFLFFEELKNKLCTNEKSLLADFSFVFRMMQKDDKIFEDVSEKSFRSFLTNKYDIIFDKLKTYEYCFTDKKNQLYNSLKK